MVTLKEFIDSEPANAMDADPILTDAEVLAWANEAVPVIGAITQGQLLGWCVAKQAISKLEVAEQSDDAAEKETAKAALIVVRRESGLDLSDTTAQAFLSVLVAKKVFTEAEINDLNEVGTVQMPRWRAAGLSRVLIGHITAVRAG